MGVNYDCKARLATLDDVDSIISFYEQRRTPAVYLRKREEIEGSINNDLFLLVHNPNGQIIAASGIYLLNGGAELEQCMVEGGQSVRSTVAELGSVLRWDKGLPPDRQYEGVWHPFLFGVPMVLLLQRMLSRPGFDIDTLVCDVQMDRVSNIQRLMGQTVDLTPLRWQLIQAGKDLLKGFKNTIRPDDVHVDNPKMFFQGLVSNLPRVADYLLLAADKGLTNRFGEVLSIDMRDLIKHWTIGIDNEGKRFTLLGRLSENSSIIENLGNLGWREFARHFNSKYAPRKGIAINGPYQVAPDSIPNFLEAGGNLLGRSNGVAAAIKLADDMQQRGDVPRDTPPLAVVAPH